MLKKTASPFPLPQLFMTKKKIVIFANGKLKNSKKAKRLASDASFIICADGGALHCFELGIIPDLLIGDFDSIPKKLRKKFEKNQVEIKQYPVHKDSTDLELALVYASRYREKKQLKDKLPVHILGALGGRWDMSLATLLLPVSPQHRHLEITIHSDHERIRLLLPGRHTIFAEPGKRLSLLPISSDVKELTLAGFEYAVKDITLKFGSSRGLSNRVEEESTLIRFSEGQLMMVLEEE